MKDRAIYNYTGKNKKVFALAKTFLVKPKRDLRRKSLLGFTKI